MPTPEKGGHDWSNWKAKKSDTTGLDLEQQVARATDAAVVEGAEAIFQDNITTRSSIGRKEILDYDPNEEGIAMPDEKAINIKTKTFKEIQNENISNLKHNVDMSGAVELGATGTDDEPFEIEHDPQIYKQAG